MCNNIRVYLLCATSMANLSITMVYYLTVQLKSVLENVYCKVSKYLCAFSALFEDHYYKYGV